MRDEYDFSNAKAVREVPALSRLQSQKQDKTRITIYIDNDILETFRAESDAAGHGYQTLINAALREYRERKRGIDLESLLRKVIREELQA